MEERRADTIMAGVLFAFTVAYFVQSFSYNNTARALPELVSGVTAAILIVYLVTSNLAGFRMRSARDVIVKDPAAMADDDTPKAVHVRQQPVGPMLVGIALPLAYLVVFVVFGILPGVFVFIFGYSWWYGKVPWVKALAVAVIVDLVVYGLFLFLLMYPIYPGLVGLTF